MSRVVATLLARDDKVIDQPGAISRRGSAVRPLCCVPFEKKIVGVTDPRPRDELIDKSAIFPGE